MRILKLTKQHLILMLLLSSCGVEVGNPTKPQPAPSAEDQSLLALVSSEHLEETVSVAAESNGSDDASLRLLATRSCELANDGSVIFKSDKSETNSRDIPRLSPKTRVAIETNKSSTATLRTTGSGLSCRAGGRIPNIDWQSLTVLQSEITMTRKATKQFSALPGATLRETVQVTAEGNRQVSWRREAVSGTTINLSRTINFHTAITRSSSLESSPYLTTVETVDPLVVKQSNQGLKTKTLVFESGSTLSDYKDGQKLILSYQNLEFIKGSSCYPESGSINAGIYSATDLKTPLLSFSLLFQSGEVSMVFGDGTTKVLEINDCSIDSN